MRFGISKGKVTNLDTGEELMIGAQYGVTEKFFGVPLPEDSVVEPYFYLDGFVSVEYLGGEMNYLEFYPSKGDGVHKVYYNDIEIGVDSYDEIYGLLRSSGEAVEEKRNDLWFFDEGCIITTENIEGNPKSISYLGLYPEGSFDPVPKKDYVEEAKKMGQELGQDFLAGFREFIKRVILSKYMK